MDRRLCGVAAVGALALAAGISPATGQAAGPKALLVGTFKGMAGQYTTIQAAVDAAQPGDWVLIAPGVYHEKGNPAAGVYITTANLHVRGMERNTTVVDGTNPGSAAPCSASPAQQDFNGGSGRNGIEVWKADGVTIENLLVCNYLASDAGKNGNEIWWNGGDGSGAVGLGSFDGAYLTASSTYYKDDTHAMAQYGIFTSNEKGPAVIAHTYASNMGDAAYYIGACPDCNVDLTDAHGEGSALGYSGTNAGGHLTIEHSEFNDNRTGIAPNSLNNDDAPSPQNGACPAGGHGPTGSGSCMLIQNNNVHDNNNANAPAFGISSAIGAGIELSGSQNDTVINNTVKNQKGWGILINDYPDTATPPPVAHCTGGAVLTTAVALFPAGTCYFSAFGTEVAHNTLAGNGGYGNKSNGDLANLTDNQSLGPHPANCWHDNTSAAGAVTTWPTGLQTTNKTCGASDRAGIDSILELQVGCAANALPCAPGSYPTRGPVTVLPIPVNLTSMSDPCADAPANAWCPATAAVAPGSSSSNGKYWLGAAAVAVVAAGLGIFAWMKRRRRQAAG
jgi:hypothetical protein